MKKLKKPVVLGLIREAKVPADERVTITPSQIKDLCARHPHIKVIVQSSAVRRITDSEYRSAGIEVVEDLRQADILLGIKEVPVELLLPGKTYIIFSHTVKKQEHNKKLLKGIVDKGITLIDWECMRDAAGRRTIGFGYYAGIVGTYNAFRGFGLLSGSFQICKAHDCKDRKEMEMELRKVKLPALRFLLTGGGRATKGVVEMLEKAGVRRVGIRDYLNGDFAYPVYCQLLFDAYYKRLDKKRFDRKSFYRDPSGHYSDFMRFAPKTDIYIAGHFWGAGSPHIFEAADIVTPRFNIRLVADISCDTGGPVPTTIRASSISEPFYGYDPASGAEVPFGTANSIGVMAVDNLPCELPRDASEGFGEMFRRGVLPSLLNNDERHILERATIVKGGEITDRYAYLRAWTKS